MTIQKLSNDMLITAHYRAEEMQLDTDFLQIILDEIERRGLGSTIQPMEKYK